MTVVDTYEEVLDDDENKWKWEEKAFDTEEEEEGNDDGTGNVRNQHAVDARNERGIASIVI